MLRILRRAVTLLDHRSRSAYLLTAPLALLVLALELCGFFALAAVVQVLAAPTLFASANRTGLVDMMQAMVHASSPSVFVATVGGVAVALLVSRGIVASLLAWRQASILARAEAVLATRLFREFMTADHRFHLERHSADLIRTLKESVRLLSLRVLEPGVTIVTDSVLVTGLVSALLIMEPGPAFASMSALGLGMLVYLGVVRREMRRIGVEDERLSAADQRLLQEGVRAVKVLTMLERRDQVVDRYATTRSELAFVRRGLFLMTISSRYYLEAVILIVAALATAAAMIEGRASALASVGVLLAGSMRLLPSVQRLAVAASFIRAGAGSIDSIEHDLASVRAYESVTDGAPSPHVAIDFDHTLELRNVTFRYPGVTTDALRSINLCIDAGESVGIVGRSGSGKTTLIDVITGLLAPREGAIHLDGVELTAVHLGAWHRQIGYIPQETVILDASVRHNVALGLGDDEIDDAAVRRALAEAQLLDTVVALPDGLDTRLGECGIRFSHGQRQRIGIARALYHRPRLLILDEATSALDMTTESEIVATIEQLYGQLTVVIIAHRLSTIQRCDTLVKLEHGRIEAIGTFDEVATPSPHVSPPVQAAR
jgi:ATP-binding cassette subfamily C protein